MMTKTKNILGWTLLGFFALIGCARWAKITFQPLYSEARFQPADQLHAGCTNSADILFAPQGQKITKFTLVLYYQPETLEILRIIPTINDGSATSKIEYNKLILEVTNPKFDSLTATKSFFQIYFKNSVAGKETITLWTGSLAETTSKIYPLQSTFDLNFAEVPECEPDIIPPSLNLIFPKDTDKRISLDQYFIFDIKDIGKGVDRTSVVVNFDGEQYFYGSENLKWNGNYLTFYPGKWIPINTHMDLNILITDKQSYGWPNTTESKYSFISATGMVLSKPISPMMFRNIAQEAEKISASTDECTLLATLYTTSDLAHQGELKSIIQKVWCDLSALDTSLLQVAEEAAEINQEQSQYRNLSVFATLWWILFLIVFTLKLHYIAAYKKHKRLNTEKWTPKQ